MIDNTGSKATKKTRHYNKTIYVEQSNKHSLTLSCYKSWPNAVRKLERASSTRWKRSSQLLSTVLQPYIAIVPN